MLSTADLERLIAVKKREINKEKMLLGIASETADDDTVNTKEEVTKPIKQVQFTKTKILTERDDPKEHLTKDKEPETKRELEEIPADLERYIRRYLGLPVMLKAGEYSPNNPLIRGERPTGDALLGLGEYERRRNTLRKIRQRQYREYLDQQAKIKQEAKEKAERERREREERERLQEERERERERERELERDVYVPERRRPSVNYDQVCGANNAYSIKVDTGVQVNNISKPLSVAVQTDADDLFRLSPTPRNLLTQAERELSPRTVVDSKDDRPIHPASWTLKEWKDPKDWRDPKEYIETKNWKDPGTNWSDPLAQDWKSNFKEPELSGKGDWNELRRELESDRDWKESGRGWKEGELEGRQERRRSYGDFDEGIKRASREKASSETRAYKPSIFDADAIELRNLQAEKEAAARRQFYQRELRHQIAEQRRIRDERNTREKMLEQAEMRRLEQQLRSLRAAQDLEVGRQHRLDCKVKDDDIEYDRKRLTLQKEIDLEQKSLIRATAQPQPAKSIPQTSKSDTYPSKLPFYYPKIQEKVVKTQENNETRRLPYSTNIPDSSVFSPNYDVDSYLRRNLNPTRESLNSNRIDTKDTYADNRETHTKPDVNRNVIVEKALVHDHPKVTERKIDRKVEGAPIVDCHRALKEDPLPIPVLRHSPKPRTSSAHETSDLSDAMKVVDAKWRVPAVQKNILTSLPSEEGKSVSILTQLGSIRRQLQLEQLKLDKMMSKDSDV